MKKNKKINLNINLFCILAILISFFSILLKISIQNIGNLKKIITITLSLKCYPFIFLTLLLISLISLILCFIKYKKSEEKYFLYKILLLFFVINSFMLLTNSSTLKVFEVYFANDNSILLNIMILFENVEERFGYLQMILSLNILFILIPLFYLYTNNIQQYIISNEDESKIIFGINYNNFINKTIDVILQMRLFLEKDFTDHYVESLPDIDYTKINKNSKKEEISETEKNDSINNQKDINSNNKILEESFEYDEENDEIVFIEHIDKQEQIMEESVSENIDNNEKENEIDEDEFISIDE